MLNCSHYTVLWLQAHIYTMFSQKWNLLQLLFHDQECKHPLKKCVLYWKYLLKWMKVCIITSMYIRLTTAAKYHLASASLSHLWHHPYMWPAEWKPDTSCILWKIEIRPEISVSMFNCAAVKKWQWSVTWFQSYGAKCIGDAEHKFSRKRNVFTLLR